MDFCKNLIESLCAKLTCYTLIILLEQCCAHLVCHLEHFTICHTIAGCVELIQLGTELHATKTKTVAVLFLSDENKRS